MCSKQFQKKQKKSIASNCNYSLMLGEFKMINSLLKKSNSQTICMQKMRLEITAYLQILLQTYP